MDIFIPCSVGLWFTIDNNGPNRVGHNLKHWFAKPAKPHLAYPYGKLFRFFCPCVQIQYCLVGTVGWVQVAGSSQGIWLRESRTAFVKTGWNFVLSGRITVGGSCVTYLASKGRSACKGSVLDVHGPIQRTWQSHHSREIKFHTWRNFHDRDLFHWKVSRWAEIFKGCSDGHS